MTIAIKPDLRAAITVANPASLSETNLSGADVTVTITHATYGGSLSTTNFTLNGAPAGTTINSVLRDSETQATLTLAFDGTDFDSDTFMSVTVLQAALATGTGPATTGTVTVTAALPVLDVEDGRLFYGETGTAQALNRTWDDSLGTWSVENGTAPVSGTVRWTVNKVTPDGSEDLLGVLSDTGSGAELNLVRWDGTAWIVDWSSTAITTANLDKRGFDLEYEASSGDALVVYSNNTDTPVYRTRSGGSWSGESALPLNDGAGPNPDPNTGIVHWVELTPRLGSDEITLAYIDANWDLVAIVWDGTQWLTASASALETDVKQSPGTPNVIQNRPVDVAYEETTGDALIAWGRQGVSGFYYSTRAAGSNSWSAATLVLAPVNGEAYFVDLAAEPGGQQIAGVFMDLGGGTERLGLATWTGSAWVNPGEYDSQTRDVNDNAPGDVVAAVGWLGTSGTAVAVYSDNDVDTIDWATWTAGGGWVLQPDVTPSITGKGYTESVQIEMFGGQNELMAIFSGSNADLYAATYDGATWTVTNSGSALETGLSSVDSAPFSFAIRAPTCPDGSVCWDGGGGDANWNTAANWEPDGVPGTTALVVFNGLSSKNATFNVADTIAALTIEAGYAGTITMAADLLIDHNGAECTFTQNGGTIDLGSTTFTHQCDWTYTAGTFTAGTSTVVFAATPVAMDSGANVFNNVQISMTSGVDFTVTGTMHVDGNLTITEVRDIDTGTIKVKGNVTTTDTAVGGSGIIEFTGGNAQILSAGSGVGALPSLTIAKNGGTTLTIQDTIQIDGYLGSGWIYTSGDVVAGSSTVVFNTATTVNSGSMKFNNVTLDIDNGKDLTISGTMDVDGDLTILVIRNILSGTITLAGNLTSLVDSAIGNSTGLIILDGANAQSIDINSPTGDVPDGLFTIDKTAEWVTLASNMSLSATLQDLTMTNGRLDMAGFNLTVTDVLTMEAGTEICRNGGTLTYDSLVDNGGMISNTCSGTGTALHRSVGTDSTNLNTGKTVEIVGTTATFSSDMPNTIGVGDVLEYGSTNLAFISGRTSATVYTVQSATGGTPVATAALTPVSLFRAYTSLFNWEAQTENTSIDVSVRNFDTSTALDTNNTIMQVAAYADGPDTDGSEVKIGSEWVTGPNAYIRIYTPVSTSEVGVSQRHTGVAGTGSSYVRRPTKSSAGHTEFLEISTNYVRLDGLEFDGSNITGAENVYGIYITGTSGSTDIRIENSLIHDLTNSNLTPGSVRHVEGIKAPSGFSIDLVKIANTIIYAIHNINAHTDSTAKGMSLNYTPGDSYIYNNTLFDITVLAGAGTSRGMRLGGASLTHNVTNNYVGQVTGGDNFTPAAFKEADSTTINADNNVSFDGTATTFYTTGANNVGSQSTYANYFVDVTAGTENFHLVNNSNALWGKYGLPLDADTNLPVTVDIDGEARDGTQPDVGADEALAVSAAITGTNPGSLVENTLNGATVTVTLTDGTYDDTSLLTTDFTLGGAPAGTTINSVARDSATQATLTLLFDGTDFDTNASLSVTVLQAALGSGAGPATTGTVTVTTVLESAAITGTIPVSLTETNLNGADVTVTITNATYDGSLFTTNFTLNGAPAGTTIDSVLRNSATQATLTLLFDGTDFDTNASMSVTVLQAAFSPATGPETTGTVTVTTVVESAAITGTNPTPLTETNLNGADVTVTITNATYDDPLGTGDFTLNGAPAGTTIDSVLRNSATQATLTLLFDGTDFDTNASMSVTVLQAAFSPVAGPETTGTVTVTAVVEPPLTISTMETADLDNDGFIDAIHITFSQAIKDSPASTVVADDWDVAGVTGEAFSSTTNGDAADDADIYITFTDGVLDTGQTPQVTYTQDDPTDSDVKDLAGTLLANVTPGTATVQRGTVTMAASATSVDGTITTPVVLANTLLLYQSRNASAGPLGFSVTGQLIDTTTVRFQRNVGDATAADIDWQVWEDSNLTVQRGSIADLSGSCNNVTISTVDLSKSFVLVAMRNHDTATQDNNFIRARLTTTTNLELCVAKNSSGAQGVEWQVAEYANAAVQRGQLVFGTADASLTAAITSVDLSKAMLLYSWEAETGTEADIGQKLFQGKFDTSTQISVTRDNTGSAATVNWEVIEFTDGKSVQSGDLNFATAETQKDVTISEVTLGKAISFIGGQTFGGQAIGRSAKSDDDVPGIAMWTAELTSTTNLQLTRAASGTAADLTWFVLTDGGNTVDKAKPVLLSASAPNGAGATAGLFNDVNDRLDLVFSETLNPAPSEANLEAALTFAGGATDVGDNLPATGAGSDPIALATTTIANDTIQVTFNTSNTVNANLLTPGTHTVQVTTGTNITDVASNTANTTPAPVPIGDSLDLQVTVASDDANERDRASEVPSLNADLILMDANTTDVRHWGGFRWTNVTVPPGATITTALLDLNLHTNQDDALVTVYGENVDNAATFTATTDNIKNRPKTTASVPWAVDSLVSGADVWLSGESPDARLEVKSLVQEIVSRPGWSSGNALVLFSQPGTAAFKQLRPQSYDQAPVGTLGAKLHIEYTVTGSAAPHRVYGDGERGDYGDEPGVADGEQPQRRHGDGDHYGCDV